jgi:hypothetical protein
VIRFQPVSAVIPAFLRDAFATVTQRARRDHRRVTQVSRAMP